MALLGYILIATLFSFGWSNAFNEGQIFEKAGKWMEAKLPEWLHKPLFSCPKCNSFHVFWIMNIFLSHYIWYWCLIGGICSSGLSSIIIGFQNKLEDIADQL